MCRRGQTLSPLLSLFVSYRWDGGGGGGWMGEVVLGIQAGLSLGVLRISGGLWGGTAKEGGQTKDNDPRSSAMKRQSYKFIYLLSADLSSELAHRGEPTLTHNASACHNIEKNVKEKE